MIPKVTLISPYNNILSYGLRSIATYLRRNNVSVTVVYMINYFSDPYKLEALNGLIRLCEDSDLIGITLMSNYFSNCVQITKEIKSQLEIPVVWGGAHPTVAPEECLEHCDFVVLGEGEETLLELLTSIKQNHPVDNIRNIVVKKNKKICRNEVRPLVKREDIPVVDNNFSSDYMLINDEICKMNDQLLKRFMTSDYMTLSSLGCPFGCSYCINKKLKKLYDNKVRFGVVDDIIKELVNVKDRMPFIKHIWFEDDLFIMRPIEELKVFVKEYKNKINLPFFVSGLNPVYVTEEKLRILISAGMDRVKMGIQTGGDNTKKIFNRTMSNDRIIQAAHKINAFKNDLKLTSYDLILDNPFESSEDIVQTIRLLNDLPSPFTLNLYSLTFYPGTDIYQKAKSAGIVKDNVKDVYNKHYLKIENNCLNFIIVLYTVLKIPGVIFSILLKKRFVVRNVMIPRSLFQFVQFLGHMRRGLNLLMKGDPYILLRNLRLKVYK
jgi:radical SAM superfamily enzyme YgiQ (UPF0313 family)